jgi:hypothetical protein
MVLVRNGQTMSARFQGDWRKLCRQHLMRIYHAAQYVHPAAGTPNQVLRRAASARSLFGQKKIRKTKLAD